MELTATITSTSANDHRNETDPQPRLCSPCRTDQPKIREMVRLFLREINWDDDEDYEDVLINDTHFCLDDDTDSKQEDGLGDCPYNKSREDAGIGPAGIFYVHELLHPDSDVDTNLDITVGTAPQADWSNLGSDIWWERPASLFPMLIRETDTPVGFLLIASGPYTDPDTDYEVAGLFVMPDCRRRGIARAALLAAFERFPGRWEAVPANMDDAFGFWFNLVDAHFWKYRLDSYATGFQFENVPANIKRENPFLYDASGVTNGHWSMPSP